jgi:serine/threonine protein kinase
MQPTQPIIISSVVNLDCFVTSSPRSPSSSSEAVNEATALRDKLYEIEKRQPLTWFPARELVVGNFLKEGSIGKVYEAGFRGTMATDNEDEYNLVLKAPKSTNYQSKLLSEIEAMSILPRSPYIRGLVGVVTFDKKYDSSLNIPFDRLPWVTCILMERWDMTLQDFITRCKECLQNFQQPFTQLFLWDVCTIIRQISLGLMQIRDLRKSHGDLSLRNIMVRSEEREVPSSFGVPCRVRRARHVAITDFNLMCNIGTTRKFQAGQPKCPFHPPEEEVSESVDVFSMGVCIQNMLSVCVDSHGSQKKEAVKSILNTAARCMVKTDPYIDMRPSLEECVRMANTGLKYLGGRDA